MSWPFAASNSSAVAWEGSENKSDLKLLKMSHTMEIPIMILDTTASYSVCKSVSLYCWLAEVQAGMVSCSSTDGVPVASLRCGRLVACWIYNLQVFTNMVHINMYPSPLTHPVLEIRFHIVRRAGYPSPGSGKWIVDSISYQVQPCERRCQLIATVRCIHQDIYMISIEIH